MVLAIFQKDLRLFLRDRGALFLTLLAPIVMITIIALARYQSEEPRPLVPVVDDDRGPVANAFIKLLGRHADVVAMDRVDAERVVSALNRAPAAIVFPKGLSKNYLRGTASEITLLTDPAQAVALNTLRALLLLMDRDAAEIADPMHEDLLVYREHNLTGEELSPKALEQNVPGFAIMFVILAVVFGTSAGLHDELSGRWSGCARRRVGFPGCPSKLVRGSDRLRPDSRSAPLGASRLRHLARLFADRSLRGGGGARRGRGRARSPRRRHRLDPRADACAEPRHGARARRPGRALVADQRRAGLAAVRGQYFLLDVGHAGDDRLDLAPPWARGDLGAARRPGARSGGAPRGGAVALPQALQRALTRAPPSTERSQRA